MIEFERYEEGYNPEGEMTVECDFMDRFTKKACVNEEVYTGDWQECIDQAKEDGWKVKKVNGEWQHFCPDHARLS